MPENRKIVRINLIDIINLDTEEDVLYILQKVKESILFDFDVWFWYLEKNISCKDIEHFKEKYASTIQNININIKYLNGYSHYVWYDIISKKYSDFVDRYKFRLLYETPNELPSKIIQFGNFARHCSFGKRVNKNENKNSNNGFFKVGRQN